MWSCFKEKQFNSIQLYTWYMASQRFESLVDVKWTMNSSVYQIILKTRISPSVSQLKLSQKWVIKEDNDLNDTSKPTSECWKNKRTEAKGLVKIQPG